MVVFLLLPIAPTPTNYSAITSRKFSGLIPQLLQQQRQALLLIVAASVYLERWLLLLLPLLFVAEELVAAAAEDLSPVISHCCEIFFRLPISSMSLHRPSTAWNIIVNRTEDVHMTLFSNLHGQP